jgi:hypothetical protein
MWETLINIEQGMMTEDMIVQHDCQLDWIEKYLGG